MASDYAAVAVCSATHKVLRVVLVGSDKDAAEDRLQALACAEMRTLASENTALVYSSELRGQGTEFTIVSTEKPNEPAEASGGWWFQSSSSSGSSGATNVRSDVMVWTVVPVQRHETQRSRERSPFSKASSGRASARQHSSANGDGAGGNNTKRTASLCLNSVVEELAKALQGGKVKPSQITLSREPQRMQLLCSPSPLPPSSSCSSCSSPSSASSRISLCPPSSPSSSSKPDNDDLP